MSYNTWHDYGYGFCVSRLNKTALKRIEQTFNVDEDDKNYLDEDDLVDFWDNWLQETVDYLNEKYESKSFIYSTDFDGDMYIMFAVSYPWYSSEKDKSRTTKEIDEIFCEYMKPIVGNENFSISCIDYCDVENGG